jgi:hypothetical protein
VVGRITEAREAEKPIGGQLDMFGGELQDTISLLAYEHGLSPGEISFAEVGR